jgi:hypothetical protein
MPYTGLCRMLVCNLVYKSGLLSQLEGLRLSFYKVAMSGTLAKRPSNEEEDSSLPQEPTPQTFPFVFQEPKNALGNDALQLQDRLAERVQSWERPRPVSEPEVVKVPDDKSTERGLIVRRVAKTVLALALALALGWTPLQRLLQSTSSEATVNARLITLRAPINGEISLPRQLADAGTPVLAGDEILRIVNRRADRAHLDDLRRTIDGMKV